MCFKFVCVIGKITALFLFLDWSLLNYGLVNAECLHQPSICKPISDCPEVFNHMEYIGKPDFCDSEDKKVCCPLKVVSKPSDMTNPWINHCNEYAKMLGSPQKRPFVIDGSEATPHEFPFMALIGLKQNGKIKWTCGGTLITPSWVLTAAHCIDWTEKKNIVVRLGEHDYSSADNITQDFENVNPVVHVGYVGDSNHRNDITLIDLNRNASLNSKVMPACMPITDTSELKYFEAAGWGKTNNGDVSTKLLKVKLVSSPLCTEIQEEEDSNKICAVSDENRGNTCSGDSGGPLFVPHPDKDGMYQVVGITSHHISGYSCGEILENSKVLPGLYTRVSAFMDWIDRHLSLI